MDKKTMQHLNRRWLFLAISAFAMLFAGIIYAWSILKQPFEAAFGWEASHLALNFTIIICCFLSAFICLTIIFCIAAALSAVIREPKQI